MLPIARDLGFEDWQSRFSDGRQQLAAAMGDATWAARWSGAAAAIQSAIGFDRRLRGIGQITSRSWRGCAKHSARRNSREATAEGAALDYEEALAEAQAWLDDPERWAHAFEQRQRIMTTKFATFHHATAFRQSGDDNSTAHPRYTGRRPARCLTSPESANSSNREITPQV